MSTPSLYPGVRDESYEWYRAQAVMGVLDKLSVNREFTILQTATWLIATGRSIDAIVEVREAGRAMGVREDDTRRDEITPHIAEVVSSAIERDLTEAGHEIAAVESLLGDVASLVVPAAIKQFKSDQNMRGEY